MSDNPDGTPNPLNPTPVDEKAPETGDTKPSEEQAPAEEPVVVEDSKPEEEIKAEEKTADAEPEKDAKAESAQPMPEPIEAEATPEPIKVNETKEQILSSEPELKGSIVEPANKSNKGWLVALIVLLVAAVIGGVVAAIVLLHPFGNGGGSGGGDSSDVVSAFKRLFSADGPENIAFTGDILFTVNDVESELGISSVAATVEGGINTKTYDEYFNAGVSAESFDGRNASLALSQMYTSKGDMYLKLSDISFDTLQEGASSNSLQDTEVDCTTGNTDSCTDPSVISPSQYTTTTAFDVIATYLGYFKYIEGDWIHMSTSSVNTLGDDSYTTTSSQCLMTTLKDATKYTEELRTLYSNNTFISFAADTTGIKTKNSTLYKMNLDEDKLVAFINSLGDSTIISDFAKCMGTTVGSTTVNRDMLSTLLAYWPDIYVEASNGNITRLLVKDKVISNAVELFEVEADFTLKYPEKTVINEPTQYVEIENVVTKIYSAIYNDMMKQYKNQ